MRATVRRALDEENTKQGESPLCFTGMHRRMLTFTGIFGSGFPIQVKASRHAGRDCFLSALGALDKRWGQAPDGHLCGQPVGPSCPQSRLCGAGSERDAQLDVKLGYPSAFHSPLQTLSASW